MARNTKPSKDQFLDFDKETMVIVMEEKKGIGFKKWENGVKLVSSS